MQHAKRNEMKDSEARVKELKRLLEEARRERDHAQRAFKGDTEYHMWRTHKGKGKGKAANKGKHKNRDKVWPAPQLALSSAPAKPTVAPYLVRPTKSPALAGPRPPPHPPGAW